MVDLSVLMDGMMDLKMFICSGHAISGVQPYV